MSGGASFGSATAWTISSACTTCGDLRTVVARPADSDGLILLVCSSAWNFGSGGPIGAATLAAGAFACATTPVPPAVAGSPAGASAQGALPGTSFVSNLITSTGHPSAAIWIDGVNGARKSGL